MTNNNQNILSPFPHLWKRNSQHTNPYKFVQSCQNLEKTNDPIPRKRQNQWMDRVKDGQALFFKTLPTTAKPPKYTNKNKNITNRKQY